jgi:hypothetical protein
MTQPYQPYPTGARMPESRRPPIPRQVTNAVRAMYAGAAASIVGIVIEIRTVNATKTAIQKRSHHLTASQINNLGHALVIGIVIGGVIAVVVWIVIARACQGGSNTARIIGTALFALATLEAIGSSVAPLAVAAKAWWPVIWLAGLIAVIFLWQRPSTAFFKQSQA